MSFSRKIKKSVNLENVVVVQHSSFTDARGSLWSTFDKNLLDNKFFNEIDFHHDKFAINCKNVLRGIHGDYKSWKLVTVVSGSVLQVVVDCRPDSPNFLDFEKWNLSDKNPTSILIPPGFGNAFLTLENFTTYHYKLAYPDKYHDADEQFTFRWDDPRVGINWPIEEPILSERDKNAKNY